MSELQEIVLGCKNNSKLEQTTLYERYYSNLRKVVNRYVPCDAIGQDICSDAFIKIFTKIDLETPIFTKERDFLENFIPTF